MLNRSVPLVVCLSVWSAIALAQNPQGVGYAVQFASTASGKFQVFPENASTFATSSAGNTGPAAPSQIVAKPDGSKFYMVGENTLADISPNFSSITDVNGLSGTFSSAVISPNGTYLLLATAQTTSSGAVYVINTSNDTVVANIPIGGNIIGMVVSQDSTTAWVLGESSETFITTINLTGTGLTGTPNQSGSSIFLRDPTSGNSLGGNATSFSMSPLGDLYVTAGNQILQIDPAVLASCQTNSNCAPNTIIQINATPGPLQFTYIPSSTGSQLYAYFVNQTPNIGGISLYRIPIPWVSGDSPVSFSSNETFDKILIAGQQRIFAHSPADSTLWDVAPDLSSVTVSSLQSVLPATQIYSIAVSDELPSAQYLFAVSGNGSLADVYMVSLSSNSVVGQSASSIGLGQLQFVYVPSQNPTGFTNPPLTYNNNQTNLSPGQTALPLIAKILDQAGNPVYGIPVTFTGDPSLTIVPASTTTNGNGFVQAKATVGSNPGNYPVTMTIGSGSNSITGTFNLAIPGASTGGGGTGTGSGGQNFLSIVTGNGQMFVNSTSINLENPNALLTVMLVDANGNPVNGATVNYAVTGSVLYPGAISYTALGAVQPSLTTGPVGGFLPGQAAAEYQPQVPPEGFSFVQSTVVATAVNSAGVTLGTATFIETYYQYTPGGYDEPNVTVLQPNNSGTFTLVGPEGTVIPGAIQVKVIASSQGVGEAIPNVGIRIGDALSGLNAGPGTCQGNPLSDQNGLITCNFVPVCAAALANQLGTPVTLPITSGFTIEVGEAVGFGDYAVDILPGTAQILTASNGNNQTGNAGSTLPIPLNVTVTDSCGSPVTSGSVTWKVTSGSATLSSASTPVSAGGVSSTKLTLGSTPGPVTVVASINGLTSTASFTENVNATVGSLTLSSGGAQTALEGAAFTNPLVFVLKDNNGNPLPNLTVNFSLAGGSASIGATSAVTNSQGQASVTVTAGNSPGTVTVNATYGSFTTSATLTVQAPGPNVTSTSFVNAASFQTGLVPCGLATVTGTGLASSVNGVVLGSTLGIGPLPYTLEGVTITIDGIPAPILSVSNQNGVQQVNFQTPCETPAGSGTVVIQVGSGITTIPGVVVYAMQPGIFTYAGPSNLNYAAIISASSGEYLTPSNLAVPGQTYYMVVTGMGQTSPAATTNDPGTGTQTIAPSQVVLAIDNIGVPVTSVQYLQGTVGEYLITFTIPSQANGQAFPTGMNLPITLGGIVNGQTIYDSASVDIPGIQ